MKTFLNKQELFFASLLAILLLVVGCYQSKVSKVTPVAEGTPDLFVTASTSFTPSNTSTRPIKPTVSSSSFINLPTIIWTTLPTLSRKDAESRAANLLQNNGGCRLPCWWGIIPGKTSASGAIQLLATFTDLKTVLGAPGNEHSANVEQGLAFDYMESTYRIFGDYGSVDYTFQNGTVDTISAYHGGGTGEHRAEMYQLSRILDNYGKTGEIWLSAAPDSPLGSTADLYLFYGDQGIFVHYIYYDLDISNDKLHICPQGIGPEELNMWSPSLHRFSTFEEYFSLHPIPWPTFKVATGMDTETFFQSFQKPSSNLCFETPITLWKYLPPTTTP